MTRTRYCNMCEGNKGIRIEMDEIPKEKIQKEYYKCPLCRHIIKIQEKL